MYVWDYLGLPRDLERLKAFREDVKCFLSLRLEIEEDIRQPLPGQVLLDEQIEEMRAAKQKREADKHEFGALREGIARDRPRIREIVARLDIPEMYVIRDPIMGGGAEHDFPILQLALHPDSGPGGVLNETHVLDFLNECIGAAELRLEERTKKVRNPFKWLWDGFQWLLRSVPFVWQMLRDAMKRTLAAR